MRKKNIFLSVANAKPLQPKEKINATLHRYFQKPQPQESSTPSIPRGEKTWNLLGIKCGSSLPLTRFWWEENVVKMWEDRKE